MSKEFDYVIAKHDPMLEKSVQAGEIIRQFVIERGLIVYGGSAIDYALRLKGSQIYPDNVLTIPDWDFFSPNSVTDAYDLTDILYRGGVKEARAIVGQHVETMRVDVGSNHFVADVTYMPASVFAKLPTVVYNGVKAVHPDFQRIDLHSSLAFPFGDPPREVIFARWKKDIERFNILAGHYPIEAVTGVAVTSANTPVSVATTKLVFTGFAAYALIYAAFLRDSAALGYDTTGIPAAAVSIADGVFTFDSDGTAEIVDVDPAKALEKITGGGGATGAVAYDPYINLIPARTELTIGRVKYIIYDLHEQLVGVNSAELDGGGGGGVTTKVIRFTGIQYTMKHFLSKHFMNRDQPRAAATYLLYYTALLKMITRYDAALAGLGGAGDATTGTITRAVNSVFYPSIRVYGNDNVNLARGIALNRLRHDIYGEELAGIPSNYYPERMKAHPSYDPVTMEFYHEEGKKRE